jgi:hypothetical protein
MSALTFIQLILFATILGLSVFVFIIVRRKKLCVLAYVIIMFLLLVVYCEVIGERRVTLAEIRPGVVGPSSTVRAFTYKYDRYPLRISEMMMDANIRGKLEDDYPVSVSYKIMRGAPFRLLTKKPDFNIKTYIEDTLVHCVLYSYGFDYDDDSLKHIAFDYHESMLPNPSAGLWYILSPVPLDGDIIIEHLIDDIDSPRWPEGFIDSVLTLQNRIW